MAQERLSIRFRASQTIREIITDVHAHGPGPDLPAFIEVMITVEDFLYAETFDASRVGIAKKRLAELERLWK